MKILAPISFRKRDHAVAALVKAGSASDDQLFEAQFGEWPVRGLDKDTACDDIVHFKGFHSDKKLNPLSYAFRMGYTRKEDEQDKTVYLNGALMSPLSPVLGLLTTRMALARAHDLVELGLIAEAPFASPVFLTLSILSSYRFALASSISKLIAPSIADLVGEEQIHIKQFKEDNKNIARAAFQGVANDTLNNQDPLARNFTALKQAVDMVLTLMPRAYFSADYELQARLHNVIVRGYPAWQKIPQDVDELYVALQDMGIKSPAVVREYYADKQFDSLKSVFRKHASFEEAYLSPPNAEMNIGLNSYRNRETLEMYWRDCLPYLYADLLVKYGDSKGLEKFGYDPQEKDVLGISMQKKIEPPSPE